MSKKLNIWIDLTNSPHILFFRPLIKELYRKGHRLTITTRNYAQTVALADYYDIRHRVIGRHGGKSILGKYVFWAKRVIQLFCFAFFKNFDLALSHNSYSQITATWLLGIPSITFCDFENLPQNKLAFCLAKKIIVPYYFKIQKNKKFCKIGGFREQIYLSDFTPQKEILKQIKVDPNKIIVTLRPPAEESFEHAENNIFPLIIKRLGKIKNVVQIILTRNERQLKRIGSKKIRNLVVFDFVVDGPSLIFYSDLVISAGNSMNREAAILGTPAYSVFTGERSQADKDLEDCGRLILINNILDINKIKIVKKKKNIILAKPELANTLVNEILMIAK